MSYEHLDSWHTIQLCLVLWMPMKKHISTLVSVAIMLTMPFGVQQSQELQCAKKLRMRWPCRYTILVLRGPDAVGHLPQAVLEYRATRFYHMINITQIKILRKNPTTK